MTTTVDVFDDSDGLTSLREAFLAVSNDNADSTIVIEWGRSTP